MTEDRDALVEELRAIKPTLPEFGFDTFVHVPEGLRDRVVAALSILPPTTSAGDGELVEHLQERLLNEQMLAFKWMDAHDKLKAGKPYSFPAPADLPDALARVKELEEALTAAEAKTREEDARREGTEQHLCGHCGAQYLLMGADYLDRLTEALDAAGAPKWSPDRSVMYSITDRIAALAAIRSRIPETDNGR